MADLYQDPKSSLSWLFQPNAGQQDADMSAAAAAIGGGMPGSQFAQNNQLRLRAGERANFLKLGHELLNPYLQRESDERRTQMQINAQAAQQAITESGAMSRLNAEQAGALQRALISGNQQAAHDLLTEAGADRRQSATLANSLLESTMRNQAGILQSLLSYAGSQGKGGAGAGGAAGGARMNDISTSNLEPGIGVNPSAWGDGGADVPHWGDPNYARANAGGGFGAGGTGITGKLGSTLDSILRQYGLN